MSLRTKIGFAFLIGLTAASLTKSASGQDDSSTSSATQTSEQVSKSEQEATAERSAKEWIKMAYAASKKADSPQDLEQTISLCLDATGADLTTAQSAYLDQLRSWALCSQAKLLDSGDSEKAIQKCTEAVRIHSQNWKARLERAYRYSRLGKTTEAIADLDAAIRLAPSEGMLWFNRAELQFQQKNFEVAAADYSEAIRLDRTDVQALAGRGHCQVRLGNLDLALKDYEQVVERVPKCPTAYLNRANLFLRKSKFQQAANDFREALTRDQSLAEAYRGVAWMYATASDPQYNNAMVAEKSIKRAIELDGKETPPSLVVLAAAQACDGKYSMARDTIQRVQSIKELAEDTQRRLDVLLQSKWYIAGTGKK